MVSAFAADDAFVNSIIGEGTRFRGDLEIDGLLRIDGDYIGTIRTAGKVLVGRNGRAQCVIRAGTVVVGGVVKGDIHASERVIVLTSGMIIGTMFTPRLIVEEGVLLDGSCIIGEGGRAAGSRRSAAAEESEARSKLLPFRNTGTFGGDGYSFSSPADDAGNGTGVQNRNSLP